MISFLDAMADPNLFGPFFGGDSWDSWRKILPQIEKSKESYGVVGRGSGKSRIGSSMAVAKAAFTDYTPYLAPGQQVTHLLLAADRKQAREDFVYAEGLVDSVPMIARMIVNRTKESLEFSNRTRIEVQTSNFIAVRGYTIGYAFCDEIAFWPADDSSSPDTEVIRALKPGLGRIPNSQLFCASSPYARRGVLWNAYKKHFGKEPGNVFVFQAETKQMNPTSPNEPILELYESDPAAAEAEYGAQFRRDVESFVSPEIVAAAVIEGTYEVPPISGIRYHGFVDPAGGSGSDSMTLAISHKQDDKVFLDCVCEVKPPFSPESTVKEFAKRLKSYNNISKVTGDRWAGEFVREPFRKEGIMYEVSDKPKSDIYRDFLPLLNSSRVYLLDNSRLINQLYGLERKTGRSGKDSIDHGPGPNSHDDVINSSAGSLVIAAVASTRFLTTDDLGVSF